MPEFILTFPGLPTPQVETALLCAMTSTVVVFPINKTNEDVVYPSIPCTQAYDTLYRCHTRSVMAVPVRDSQNFIIAVLEVCLD